MSQQTFSRRFAHCLAAAALFASAGIAQAVEYKIGFVNTERLFREATPAKRAQAKIEKEFATRDGEIQKLAKLHDSGALSDEEFAAAKAKILGI